MSSGKSGWFVLMLFGTRTDGNTSQMSRESVAVQHEVASLYNDDDKIILLIAAIVILWQFLSGLWLSKTANTTTKETMMYLPIPPHGKSVFKTPRRSVSWQEQVQQPRSSWLRFIKAIHTTISFQGSYTTQRRWSGKSILLEEHLWRCFWMNSRQTTFTFSMLTTATIKVELPSFYLHQAYAFTCTIIPDMTMDCTYSLNRDVLIASDFK